MERSARLNSGVGVLLYWLNSFASMSTGGGMDSVTVTVVHDGDANVDETADEGVGGPDLEYMTGDMELCLLLL